MVQVQEVSVWVQAMLTNIASHFIQEQVHALCGVVTLEEVDSVNNIPAVLAQVLLKLPQDISNPGCIVQVHLQRVLQEE